MTTDRVAAIGIDAEGSLWVRPETAEFPYIYREGMEVGWDAATRSLTAPRPREWTYLRWFQQIRRAAREQGVSLVLTPTTEWSGIAEDLRRAITESD